MAARGSFPAWAFDSDKIWAVLKQEPGLSSAFVATMPSPERAVKRELLQRLLLFA